MYSRSNYGRKRRAGRTGAAAASVPMIRFAATRFPPSLSSDPATKDLTIHA